MEKEILYKVVKFILLNEWDPIGINEFEEAHDEYDAYVSPICNMLAQGKSAPEIYTYLRWAIGAMGLDGDELAERAVAERLAALSYTL